MIADAETVARKEMKEIVVQRTGGRGRQSFWRTAIIPIVIGILFGFQTANGDGAFAVFPIGFFAMTSAAAMITDAIAGERERHTLETLLASPVSDSAILLGKIAAVVAYAWAIALVQLAGVWGTSIAIGHGLSPGLVLVVAVLALLEAVLAAGFGVQLSMRAPTVRAAARKLGVLSFLMVIPISLLNVFVASVRGDDYYALIVVGVFLGLAAIDAGVFLIAKTRFRRSQLLLD